MLHPILPYRLVHSFTCAGILQTQYVKLSLFAGLGTVKNGYIRQGLNSKKLSCYAHSFTYFIVYNKRGYVDLVSHAAELSMQATTEEVQALPHYESGGEVRTCNDYCARSLLVFYNL